jgi:hypothetical protein
MGKDMTAAKDFEEFFESFNKSGVKYLIVGGYAFALHAHPRYTGDMDVFVDTSEDNARRIILALADFGFSLPTLSWKDFTTPERVLQLGHPPLRIDIMTAIDGVTFSEAWPRRFESVYGDQRVHFISKADLIANKKASGRSQDLLDLESLA